MNKKEMAALVAEKDLSPLPDREREILERFYLRDETLAETGAALGYTRERISDLRYQALYRLNVPVATQHLSRVPFSLLWGNNPHPPKTRS